MLKQIDTATEVQAVALLARRDTYKSIADDLGISVATVSNIKERNKDNIAKIQGDIMNHKIKQSKKLLEKTHDLIERRLSAETDIYIQRDDMHERFESGDLTYTQYIAFLRANPTITLNELTGLSREMFNESQIEEGKPTSIPGNATPEVADKLQSILDAMNRGDDTALLELMDVE